MCGIFALLNISSQTPEASYSPAFLEGKRRGPETSSLYMDDQRKAVFGFHRLAINGLDLASNQPFFIEDCMLICNGEIYNHEQLEPSLDKRLTKSDCETIIYMYRTYGIDYTLNVLDGVFAFVLLDMREQVLYVARDPFGVRPLYVLTEPTDNTHLVGFASEIKPLVAFNATGKLAHFPPATYAMYKWESMNRWEPVHPSDVKTPLELKHRWRTNYLWRKVRQQVYFTPAPSVSLSWKADEDANLDKLLMQHLKRAVYKRCATTQRPVACLLSGGIDSSLVAGFVAQYFRETHQKPIETYSIGLAGSQDLKYARIAAESIQSIHHEIVVTEEEMVRAIPEVVEAIESYDTTTVRASLGNYLVGKYIATHSEAKVIFNGDGSDELFGGYLYFNRCPNVFAFDKEVRRLLQDIHLYDVLRSDKCISSHGLEPRTPFLDKTLVNFVLSAPFPTRVALEKRWLRSAAQTCREMHHLPDAILLRRKEAFSDGVSSADKPFYKVLQEHIAQRWNEFYPNETPLAANVETEKRYYKGLFLARYPEGASLVPYYWMPKYANTDDPSATTLEEYTTSPVEE